MYFKTLIFFFGNQKSLHYCQLTETRPEAPRTKALRKREKETEGWEEGKQTAKEDRKTELHQLTAIPQRGCAQPLTLEPGEHVSLS